MNDDVVGAAPTGNAPTTSERSTILLLTKMCLILEVWRYISMSTEVDLCSALFYNTHAWQSHLPHNIPYLYTMAQHDVNIWGMLDYLPYNPYGIAKEVIYKVGNCSQLESILLVTTRQIWGIWSLHSAGVNPLSPHSNLQQLPSCLAGWEWNQKALPAQVWEPQHPGRVADCSHIWKYIKHI